MKFQFVLQLPARSIEDFDNLCELEDEGISRIGSFGIVDGHDFGSGEMNIFILTDHPQMAFEVVEQLCLEKGLWSEFKAAFRELNGEAWTVLHPEGTTQFSIK